MSTPKTQPGDEFPLVVRLRRTTAYALHSLARTAGCTESEAIDTLLTDLYARAGMPMPTPPPCVPRERPLAPLKQWRVSFMGKPLHYADGAPWQYVTREVAATGPRQARFAATSGYRLRPGVMPVDSDPSHADLHPWPTRGAVRFHVTELGRVPVDP